MFYRLKLFLYKAPAIMRIKQRLDRLLGRQIKGDPRVDMINRYAGGKSFADIGCMWGVNGLYSFIAEDAGASKIVAVDIYPESDEYLNEHSRRESRVQFVQGDVNLKQTMDSVGISDIVFCAGVLYHTPNPFDLLSRLRMMSGELLILQTQMIPEIPGIRNLSVFYPFLEENQRKIWQHQESGQRAITGPYEPQSGYGNNFWGVTPSCVEAMLKCAGFTVIEKIVLPFEGFFLCEISETQFAPISGEWTVREPTNLSALA